MEKLVLIDGNSLINRAFYAMPLLVTKDGTPTNAVYGFMNMFFRMLSTEKPTYVAVAFDLKAPTFRHKMYAEYKGTRKPMPEELRPQIPLLKEVLKLMGICTIEKEGSEADDIIGTIAKATNIETVIITGDKDSFQLVDEETCVHFTRRGITETEIYDINNFTEKTGITPSQVIELKALMGDSSDNIPGVKGVGEKTALNLIQTYGNIDNLYAHVDELKGKLKERIVEDKDTAFLSRTLATIDTSCGVDTDVEKMVVKAPFSMEVKRKFIDLEFKSLASRDDLFLDGENEEKVEEKSADVLPEKVVVSSLLEVEKLTENKEVYFAYADSGISLYFDGDKEYFIPFRRTIIDDGFNESDALKSVAKFFSKGHVVGVFGKKDLMHYLKNTVGVITECEFLDLSLMKYLVDFAGGEEKLSSVITEYNYPENLPAYSLKKLRENLEEKMKEQGVEKLYYEVELPLSSVLFDMEEAGFKIDANALKEAGKKYGEILTELNAKIRELAEDETLNVNSPKQLGELLFNKLKIGKGKKTKSGYSTNAEVLESLEGAHPIIPLILAYRRIQKLNSTYVEGFKPLIDDKTGLIHTSFNQTVTATGRLSSKEPNLQNIPVRDDEGRELRKFFVPRSSDRILIGADYSQIELRLLAAFSGCKALIDAFNSGKDVHSDTASKVFGVDIKDVTPAMRRNAKAVNFGIIYGISEYGLAKNIKISPAEARAYINAYFSTYPEVKKYMDANVAFAKETGYAVTYLGRRRYIRELGSSNYNLRQFGERVAMNMPLQGSSADIIKVAMINVAKRLKEEGLKSELILQVHDELIIDAFKAEAEQVKKILKEEMEGAIKLSVALTVEVGEGETWFDAK